MLVLAKCSKFSDNKSAETNGSQQPQTAKGCMMRVRQANHKDKKAFVKQAKAFFAAPLIKRTFTKDISYVS